eukprot:2335484-Ditylum_brightwellii.AAC.1
MLECQAKTTTPPSKIHINIMLSHHKSEYKSPEIVNDMFSDLFDEITYGLVNGHHFVSVVLHYSGCTAKTYGKVNNPLISYKYFYRIKFNRDPMSMPFKD